MEWGRITDVAIAEGTVHTIKAEGREIWHKRHHLEIEPSFLWVYPDLSVENLVFCDIDWKVE